MKIHTVLVGLGRAAFLAAAARVALGLRMESRRPRVHPQALALPDR